MPSFSPLTRAHRPPRLFCSMDAGRLHHRVTIDHQLIYPQPGWVSQDAGLIFSNTCRAVSQVLAVSGVDSRHVRALTLTNQRESVVVWDRHTGEPIDYAIGWQCQRASRTMQGNCRQRLVIPGSRQNRTGSLPVFLCGQDQLAARTTSPEPASGLRAAICWPALLTAG